MNHIDKSLVLKKGKTLSETLAKTHGVKKELKRATEPDQIQRRRVELEGARIRAEKIVAKFTNAKLSTEERQALYLQAQAISSLGILKGLCLLADVMTWGDRVKIKGKDGLHPRRTSYFEIIWDRLIELREAASIEFTEEEKAEWERHAPDGAEAPDGLGLVQALIAMDQKLANMHEMIHTMGLHEDPKMFEIRDKNNVVLTEDAFASPPATFYEGVDGVSEDEILDPDDPNVMPQDEVDEAKRKAAEEDDFDEEEVEEEGEDEEEEG